MGGGGSQRIPLRFLNSKTLASPHKHPLLPTMKDLGVDLKYLQNMGSTTTDLKEWCDGNQYLHSQIPHPRICNYQDGWSRTYTQMRAERLTDWNANAYTDNVFDAGFRNSWVYEGNTLLTKKHPRSRVLTTRSPTVAGTVENFQAGYTNLLEENLIIESLVWISANNVRPSYTSAGVWTGGIRQAGPDNVHHPNMFINGGGSYNGVTGYKQTTPDSKRLMLIKTPYKVGFYFISYNGESHFDGADKLTWVQSKGMWLLSDNRRSYEPVYYCHPSMILAYPKSGGSATPNISCEFKIIAQRVHSKNNFNMNSVR